MGATIGPLACVAGTEMIGFGHVMSLLAACMISVGASVAAWPDRSAGAVQVQMLQSAASKDGDERVILSSAQQYREVEVPVSVANDACTVPGNS